MNPDDLDAGRRVLVQEYQDRENKLKADLQNALTELANARTAIGVLQAVNENNQEMLAAMDEQIAYWRKRVSHWMSEARKVA